MKLEELQKLKGSELIKIADSLEVKVACDKTRKSLKESKLVVINRIIEKQNNLIEVKTVESSSEDSSNIDSIKSDIICLLSNYDVKTYKSANTYYVKCNYVSKVRVQRSKITIYRSKIDVDTLPSTIQCEYNELMRKFKIVLDYSTESVDLLKLIIEEN